MLAQRLRLKFPPNNCPRGFHKFYRQFRVIFNRILQENTHKQKNNYTNISFAARIKAGVLGVSVSAESIMFSIVFFFFVIPVCTILFFSRRFQKRHTQIN